MLHNDLNMIDLVITHLNHPWGPPGWSDALKCIEIAIENKNGIFAAEGVPKSKN